MHMLGVIGVDGADEAEIILFKNEYKSKIKDLEKNRLLLATLIQDKERALDDLRMVTASPAHISTLASKVLSYLDIKEPGSIKMAYRMLYERIVVEPNYTSGNMNLIFVFREGSSSVITEQEKVSVTSIMVGSP